MGEALKQLITFWGFARKGLSPEALFQTAAQIGYQAVDQSPVNQTAENQHNAKILYDLYST